MSGLGVAEEVRARPLSGGLWTLFSWLRRDERASSDSLSSAGSERTAASFAFLPPAGLARARAATPRPHSPPSDSYRRRVRERSLRRHHDRDLTLHRKYGLYGYDALTLPAPAPRDRRAASEGDQRRAAHVPGKRRAPPPPATLPAGLRRHARKRPAPQPPNNATHEPKENKRVMEPDRTKVTLHVKTKSSRDARPQSTVERSIDCKSEKYSKKDTDSKDSKPRSEKSFLKQIFENRKRNSAIEVAPTKFLPNISELDKQAAEIIESCKLRASEQNNNFSDSMLSKGDMWFCTRCLRKYNSTVITCVYCLEQKRLNGLIKDSCKNAASNPSSSYTQTEKETPSQTSRSRVSGVAVDEKQKLKEMLKEMKDSLPKRPKHDKNKLGNVKSTDTPSASNVKATMPMETPTLRIGSPVTYEDIEPVVAQQPPSRVTSEPSKGKTIVTQTIVDVKRVPVSETAVITEHVVIVAPQSHNNLENIQGSKCNVENTSKTRTSVINVITSTKLADTENKKSDEKSIPVNPNLQNPLRISSLLNPVYVPKSSVSEGQSRRSLFFSQVETKNPTDMGIKTISNGVQPTSHQEKPKLTEVALLLGSPSTSRSHSPKLTSTALKDVVPKHEVDNGPKENRHSSHFGASQIQSNAPHNEDNLIPKEKKPQTNLVSTATSTSNTPLTSNSKINGSNITRLSVEQHSRRRDLINQLEQSIARGDEKAAADAAAKLAQLRLSCSVLSFSSQIAAESSKLLSNAVPEKAKALKKVDDKKTIAPSIQASSKVNTAVQPTSILPKDDKTKTQTDRNEKPLPTKIKVEEVKLLSPVSKTEPVKDFTAEKTSRDLSLPGTSTSGPHKDDTENDMVSIEVWVEDREATRGPVRLRVRRAASVGELRLRAARALGLAARLQRWIVGRALCSDDETPLAALAGPDLAAPFYLCVVESETNTEASQIKTEDRAEAVYGNDRATDVYSELVLLERRALVPNAEPFECGVCMEECAGGAGAVLRECVHTFCRACLSGLVRHCEEPAVYCPAMGCAGVLQEREVRALVPPAEYERWLARGLAAAESGSRNAFHCRTRDCTGWALCETGVRRFPCPVCKHTNCVPCEAIHEGETCEQYRTKQRETAVAPDASQADEGTQALLDALITKGEALQCPECSAIITKKWGCDWVKCSACKTEICWVTRGKRWGPGGRGDTSAGCRCGVDGKRCHPACGYCH